ncbi:MAG: universal stress protein [Candidatus Bathyarchaeota archaeon]|nr:universal stress protein [Candidatus Bathyarchaeum tardum]WGM88568.1 MAG: universal stress protein [Candidatus Bathyarchaeum tardum]WNZ29165.1 MAG: universal stress protein [Candidatus Bathyarchaeota archaeon]
MFSKILVAIDGSKTADRAVEFALDLAGKYSAELLIVSVFYVISTPLVARGMGFSSPSTTKQIEELGSFHEKILVDAVKKAKQVNGKLKVTKKLMNGPVAHKIVETANNGQFDLIVIGNRGLGGIKEIFLGSVSDRVVDEAKCPVLIVKENNIS